MSKCIGPLLSSAAFLAVGICLAILGVDQFDRITGMEKAGSVTGLSVKVEFLYAYLGKWGVFVVFELIGMSFLIAAIDKLRTGIRAAA
jgi:hypothetical protein